MTSYGFFHTLRRLLGGQSLLRIRMNAAFGGEALSGRTVDVGGGHAPDYFSYFDTSGMISLEALDGSMSGIDFEKDPLPYEQGAVDTVVLANVLEHVYNHQHLLREVRRILSPSGSLVGFVPFWIGYHPDPRDYFRYTGEALERMLKDAGFAQTRITPLPASPFAASFNTIVLILPRPLRPVLYACIAPLEALYLKARPRAGLRTPLGYIFVASE